LTSKIDNLQSLLDDRDKTNVRIVKENTLLKKQIELLEESNKTIKNLSVNCNLSQDLERTAWEFANEIDDIFNRLYNWS